MNENITQNNMPLLIGKNLKVWRSRRDITQKEIAEKSSISQGYLSRMECGKENPTLETMCRIADSLGISLTELITVENVHHAGARS